MSVPIIRQFWHWCGGEHSDGRGNGRGFRHVAHTHCGGGGGGPAPVELAWLLSGARLLGAFMCDIGLLVLG